MAPERICALSFITATSTLSLGLGLPSTQGQCSTPGDDRSRRARGNSTRLTGVRTLLRSKATATTRCYGHLQCSCFKFEPMLVTLGVYFSRPDAVGNRHYRPCALTGARHERDRCPRAWYYTTTLLPRWLRLRRVSCDSEDSRAAIRATTRLPACCVPVPWESVCPKSYQWRGGETSGLWATSWPGDVKPPIFHSTSDGVISSRQGHHTSPASHNAPGKF
jgi:hypothetical protein